MTINAKQGGSVAGFADSAGAPVKVQSIRVTKDQLTTAKGSALAANDVFYLMDIPAGTALSAVTCNVLTAAGGTLTLDIGDGTAADEWVDGADATSTGYKAQGASGILSQTKVYAAADTLDLKIATESSSTGNWEVEVLFMYAEYIGSPRAKSAKDVA